MTDLKQIQELGEQLWEGCDGCDENDKNMWINGFVKGYLQDRDGLYTKEDVLKAGEIGEINHYDYKHIVKLLDEAKEINKHNISSDVQNSVQRTVVEWLQEQYHLRGESLPSGIFQEAKEMELQRLHENNGYWYGRGVLAKKTDRVVELAPKR